MKKLLLLFAALCSAIMMQAEIVHHDQCAPGRQRGFTQECWEDTETGKIYADAACTQELNAAEVVTYSKLATNNLSKEYRYQQIADGEYGGATFYYPCEASFSYSIGFIFKDLCSFEVHGLSHNNARLKLFVTGPSETISCQELILGRAASYDLSPGLMSIPLPKMNDGDIISLKIATRNPNATSPSQIIVSLEYEADPEITITADSKKKFCGTKDQMLTWSQAGELLYGEKFNISLEREQGEQVGNYSIHASKTGTGNPDVDVTFVDGTFTIVDGIHHSQSNPTINHLGYEQDFWEETSTRKLYSDDYLEREIDPITTKLYPKLLVNPLIGSDGFTMSESGTYDGNNFNWVATAEYVHGDKYEEPHEESYSIFEVKDDDITDARLVWYNNIPSTTENKFSVRVYINGNLFYNKDVVSGGLYEILLPKLKQGDKVKFTVVKDASQESGISISFGVSFEYLSPYGGDPDAWSIVADNKRKFSGLADPELSWTWRFVNTPSEEPEGIIITRDGGETPGSYNIHVTQGSGANSGRNVFFEDGTLEIVAGTRHEKGEPYRDGLIYSQDCWENLEDGKYYSDGYLEHELRREAVIGYPKLAVNPIVESGKFTIKESAVYDNVAFDWVAETTFEPNTNDKRSVEFKVYDEDVTNARLAFYMSTEANPLLGRRNITIYRNDDDIYSDIMLANNARPAGFVFVPLPDVKKGDIIRFKFDWEGRRATPTVAVCMQYCSPTATVAGTVDIAVGDDHNYYDIRTDVNTKLTWFNNTYDRLSQTDAQGTIGNHYGREAIVVDLGGSVGKVAVATKNVGANVVKHHQNEDLGTGFYIKDANDYTKNTLTDGWYVPSYEELSLLVEKLEYDRNDLGLKWRFEDTNTELWIPGYVDTQGNLGGEYAGSKVNATDYSIMYFQMNNTDGTLWEKDVVNDYKQDDTWLSPPRIRPFHRLNENNRCVKIETDNEVLKVFDAYSDTKISFIPKASGRETSLKLVFNGNAPIETEHLVAGTVFSHSEDGSLITMTVNGNSVEYAFDDVKEITFFDGTPSVQLHANQDPDNEGNYYTTFYSGLEAYTLPEGVKAYTATMSEDNGDTVVRLTAIEGDVLPQDEAVLLYTDDNDGNITLTIADGSGVSKSDANEFQGVDVATSQNNGSNYMLSYGQNGLGFYKMNPDMKLSANKAFLSASEPSMAKGLRMVFDNTYGGVNGIDVVNADNNAGNNIYSISGIRLNKLQKGINIVGGKKIIVK